MAQRLGITGIPNSGKSFSRRWIPDGENVILIQPSIKSSYLYTGPKNAKSMTPEELDEAVEQGKRKMLPPFDLSSPEGKFKNLEEAITRLKDRGPHSTYFDVLDSAMKHKAPGYFKPENLQGNVIYTPHFHQVTKAVDFIDKLLPWVHTVILADFTHYITETITSEEFLNRKFGNEAYARYLELAAEAFRNFIRHSDTLRRDLIVVTEFHAEYQQVEQRYDLFVPGGKMVKEKFLPSSYYDMFLFTDVKYSDDEEEEPQYRYATRSSRMYPEARSGGLYDTLYVPNNLQTALTLLRKHHGIELK